MKQLPKDIEKSRMLEVILQSWSRPERSEPLNFLVIRSPHGWIDSSGPAPGDIVLPGSFNPLHDGHLQMARFAANQTQHPCWFEISLPNVDKSPSSLDDIVARLVNQSFGGNGLLISNAGKFAEKAGLYPGVQFAVGADTILRVNDLSYYRHCPEQQTTAFDMISSNRCRFLVFGRRLGNIFVDQENISLQPRLFELCSFINRQQFEADLSSTQIRHGQYED